MNRHGICPLPFYSFCVSLRCSMLVVRQKTYDVDSGISDCSVSLGAALAKGWRCLVPKLNRNLRKCSYFEVRKISGTREKTAKLCNLRRKERTKLPCYSASFFSHQIPTSRSSALFHHCSFYDASTANMFGKNGK